MNQHTTSPDTDTGEAVKPFAKYRAHRLDGDHLYISGQVAFADGGFPLRGRVGAELTQDEGKRAARICALNVIAHAEEILGSSEHVRAVLKITVFVSTAPDFLSHHLVADGASEAFVERLGVAGEHSRSAVGVARLPMDSPVEVEAVLLIDGSAVQESGTT
ncbi:RidA family protein [Microbacterium resistens]|uniref:RidA family protein n=1 Tax=Microbacterium resistens TaxID=156977 RepID=UPI001C5878DF|nr:RidA family protein [Microbacterium resistens]MBW1640007.1 RidA family protein [Microbacterium resistens]